MAQYSALQTWNKVFVRERFVSLGTDPCFNDLYKPCRLFVDPATHSGISVYDATGELVAAFQATMHGDNLLLYRRDLVTLLGRLIALFGVEQVYYEEVFAGPNFETLKVLLSVREAFAELEADYSVSCHGINNKKWKAALGTIFGEDKAHVLYHVSQYYDVTGLSEDMVDAIGLGLAVTRFESQVVAIPKRLRYKTALYLADDAANAASIIQRQHHKLFLAHGAEPYRYQTELSLDENARYALAYSHLIFTAIPDHRYFGQILFQHGLSFNESQNRVLLGAFTRVT